MWISSWVSGVFCGLHRISKQSSTDDRGQVLPDGEDENWMPWSWKPESERTDITAAHNDPIYPRTRQRRHSFPPPSGYSFKNTPRWGLIFPHKSYTNNLAFKKEHHLSDYDRILPTGSEFRPPPRHGDRRHDFPSFFTDPTRARRISAGIEGLLADAATAMRPAFISPYHSLRRHGILRSSPE